MEVAPRRRLRALQRHVAAPEQAAKDSAALTPVQADAGFDVSAAERETIAAHRYLIDLQGVRASLCAVVAVNASGGSGLTTLARARSTSSSRTC